MALRGHVPQQPDWANVANFFLALEELEHKERLMVFSRHDPHRPDLPVERDILFMQAEYLRNHLGNH